MVVALTSCPGRGTVYSLVKDSPSSRLNLRTEPDAGPIAWVDLGPPRVRPRVPHLYPSRPQPPPEFPRSAARLLLRPPCAPRRAAYVPSSHEGLANPRDPLLRVPSGRTPTYPRPTPLSRLVPRSTPPAPGHAKIRAQAPYGPWNSHNPRRPHRVNTLYYTWH